MEIQSLDSLKIASPCSASWSGMRGDDRVRFCDSCAKQVYNLAGLTTAEARSLVEEAEGHLCIRLHRREDGTVLTADCPVGLRSAMRRRMLRLATAGFALVAALRMGTWFATSDRTILGRLLAGPPGPGMTISEWYDWAASALGMRPARGGITMGAICPPRTTAILNSGAAAPAAPVAPDCDPAIGDPAE